MKAFDPLLDTLNTALLERRIGDGFALLDNMHADLATLPGDHPLGPALLLVLAQWIDLGYHDQDLFQRMLQTLLAADRRTMPLKGFLLLRMSQAYAAMAEEKASEAVELLDFVLRVEQELVDAHLIMLAHFWKGRAHRKKGDYAAALHHILAARELAQHMHASKITAVIKFMKAGCFFRRKSAVMRFDCWTRQKPSLSILTTLCRSEISSQRAVALSVVLASM